MSQDDLNARIAKAQAKIDEADRPSQMSAGRGMGLGFRMASDFAAAVIVGVVLGLGIDAVFRVSPWGVIICLLLGFLAGVRNVVAAASRASRSAATNEVTIAKVAAGEVTKGEGDKA